MKKRKRVWFKKIVMHPFDLNLLVFVGKDSSEIGKVMAKVLKGKKSYWTKEAEDAPCSVFRVESVKNGAIQVVMILPSFDPKFIVHECVHATWSLNKHRLNNNEFSHDTQETQAYMVDYLFQKITKLQRKHPYNLK